MASTTSALALTKPANGENYSLDVWNGNMQKIDDFAIKLVQMKEIIAQNNDTTYTMTVPFESGRNRYALLVGFGVIAYISFDTNGTAIGCYRVWTRDDLNTTISAVRNSATSVTFTFNNTQWGGIRLLWLN